MKTSRVRATLKAAARRLTAGLICVCIILSMADIALPALAWDFKGRVQSGTTVMEYTVWAWHSDSERDAEVKRGCIYIQEDGKFACEGELKPDEEYGGTITIQPGAFGISDEAFLGFSISAGQDAASIDENGNLVIKYTPNVHIVKAHAFFKSAGVQVAGSADEAVYGGKDGLDNPEQDTALVWGYPEGTTDKTGADLSNVPITEVGGSYIMQSADKAEAKAQARVNERLAKGEITVTGSTEGVIDWKNTKLTDAKVYKTTPGLHTDKTVSVLKEGNREYQLDLESWFVGNNKANVGLILDASGSMAFSSENDKDGNKAFTKITHTDGKLFEGHFEGIHDADEALEAVIVKMDGVDGAVNIADKILTNEEVKEILNSANPSEESNTGIVPTENTDNSSLGYTGYNFYIFDKRPSTNEYVPIGYWDGTEASLHRTGGTTEPGGGGSEGGGGDTPTPSTGMPGFDALVGYYDFQKETFLDGEDKSSEPRSWAINRIGGQYAKKVEQVSSFEESYTFTEGNDINDHANNSEFKFEADDGLNVSLPDTGDMKGMLLGPTVNSGENRSFTISFNLHAKEYKNIKDDDTKANRKEDDIMYIGGLDSTTTDGNYFRLYRGETTSSNRLRGKNGSTKVFDMNNQYGGSTKPLESESQTYTFVFTHSSGDTFDLKVYHNGVAPEYIDDSSSAQTKEATVTLAADSRIILGGLTDNYNGLSTYIDNIYVFTEALSASDVKTLYNDYQNNEQVKEPGETQAQPWEITPASGTKTSLLRAGEEVSDADEVMPGYSTNPDENHLVSYYDFQKETLFYDNKAHDSNDNARTWGINRTQMDAEGNLIGDSESKYAEMIEAVDAGSSINFNTSGTEVKDDKYGSKDAAIWNNFNWDENYGLNVSYASKNSPLTKALLLDGVLNTADHRDFTVSFTLSSKQKYGNEEKYAEDGNYTTGRDQILYIGPLENSGSEKNYLTIYRDSGNSDSRLKIDGSVDGKNKVIFTMKHFETILGLREDDTPTPITYTLTFDYNEDTKKTNVKVYRDGRITRKISESDVVDNVETNIELSEDCRVILGGLKDNYDGQDLYVDNVYIFDEALNSSEVSRLYNKYQSDENVKQTGTAQAQPWTITPKPDPETDPDPDTPGDGLLYFSANANNSATALLQEQIDSTPAKDRAGWYYVTSTSQWENILEAGTAKTMDALRNDVKDGEGNVQPYYYDGYTTEDPDKTVEGKLNSEIAPDGTPEGGYYYYQPKQFEPLKFFLDEKGHLCCFYSTGNAGMDANGWSHVYMKKNTTRIKAEVLQHALGRFVTKLSENTPGSTIGAVRFSTQRYGKSSETFESTGHTDEFKKFNLLNWTNDAQEAISILNNERGDGSDTNGVTANDDGQYNYVLTGNTSTAAGFQTYNDCLAKGVDKDPNTKKYLIVFTDGKDSDYETYKENLQEHPAVKAAKEYREGTYEYTIIAVMLAGGTVTEGSDDYNSALRFLAALTGEYTESGEGGELKAPANKEDGGNGKYQYVYVGHSSDELEAVFETIGEEIADDLDNYVVQDYIDPRFDLVDAYGSVWTLGNDGNVTVQKTDDSQTTTTIDETGKAITLRSDSKIEGTASKLCYDSKNEMYYLEWDGVRIPGCSAGDTTLPVWNAQITIKAKDDFIGGNTILTNGDAANENFVYPDMEKINETRPDDSDTIASSSGTDDAQRNPETGSRDMNITNYPSKGFPRTTVNVGATEPEIKEGRQVLFMGEGLTNADVAKKLGANVEAQRYWDYLELYAKYQKKSFDELIEELVASPGGVTYPYYYLSDVDAAVAAGADVEQLGTLTFKWEDNEAYPTDGITNDSSPRRSSLTVQYTPIEDRTDKVKGEVEDTDYQWNPEFKPADGASETTDEITGSYTTNIVSGEIAFEMELSADVVEYLQKYAPGKTVKYQANLVKKESGGEKVIGTYTAEYEVPNTPDESPAAVTRLATIVYEDDTYTKYGLPMGEYAVKPIGGSGFGITFADKVDNVTLTSATSGFSSFDADTTKKASEMIDPSTEEGPHTVDEFAADYEGGTIKIGGGKIAGKASDESNYLDKRYAMAKIGASIDTNALSISKKVVGAPATDANKEFVFTITLDGEETAENGTYTYKGNPTTVNGDPATADKKITFTGGVATVTLKDAGWITIQEILADTKYTVSEADDSNYNKTVTGSENGTISAEGENSVAYTNTYKGPTPGDTVKVTYDLNGGKGTVPAEYANAEYEVGNMATLWPAKAANVTRSGAVFLGWSAEPHPGIIKSQAEEDKVTIITKIESIDADTTVYAVWAVDENGNGVPDYRDPDPKPGPGTDPDPGPKPDDPIDRSEHYGYIIGVTATEVRPELNITRAEIATILFRLLTDEARQENWSEESGFPDVKSGAWYNHAVAVLHNLGIVEGDDYGNFNPDARITRAEVAAMVVRFYEKTEGTVLNNRFTDVEETKWYAQEVLLADHYGLMQGDGDQFRPEDPLTRAEAMTVFNRLLGRKPHKDYLHNDMIVWADNMDKRKWYYADVQEATNSHECGRDVVIDGKTYETWESIKPMRDWAALEY